MPATPPVCAAVIVGAGSSSRFGGDKLTAILAGRPMLAWSLRAFARTAAISEIVLVAPRERVDEFEAIAYAERIAKLKKVVAGADHRHESVLMGIKALGNMVRMVAIHDAARPLVTTSLIDLCIQKANKYGAAAAAVPVIDTLHLADSEGCAIQTVDRDGLWAMQTPQVFSLQLITELITNSIQAGINPTDEVSVAVSAGLRIPFVNSPFPNPKITWPADIEIAEALMTIRGEHNLFD